MIKIAPSLLSADLLHLATEIKTTEQAADLFHIDVMDGHFVPNLTFGPSLVAQLSKFTEKELDVHLMLDQPHKFIDKFLQAGANYLSFHIEANLDHGLWISKIKKQNCKAGIVINPDSDVQSIIQLLPALDFVLVMTVFPGYGGQKYRQDCTKKIAQLKRLQSKHKFMIEVDGGINLETARKAKASGADILVAGSFIFNNKREYSAIIKELRDV